MKLKCKSVGELDDIAATLLSAFPEARVFALYGAMGAGKTTLVKALCSKLGVVDIVQSPTFSIVNEYLIGAGGSVFHFDFYRIRTEAEVYDLGYEEYLYSGSYCFLEWPELVESLLPEGHVKVTITGTDDRLIEF